MNRKLSNQLKWANKGLKYIGRLSHASDIYDDLLNWIINVEDILKKEKTEKRKRDE